MYSVSTVDRTIAPYFLSAKGSRFQPMKWQPLLVCNQHHKILVI